MKDLVSKEVIKGAIGLVFTLIAAFGSAKIKTAVENKNKKELTGSK